MLFGLLERLWRADTTRGLLSPAWIREFDKSSWTSGWSIGKRRVVGSSSSSKLITYFSGKILDGHRGKASSRSI